MTPNELSPSEAARRIGASTRSVQRWIALGRLPARRVGGRWRVAYDALDALIGAGHAEVAPPVDGNPPVSPIRALYIANRGEIVRRIRRTAESLGIAVVAPAMHGPAALDLLDVAAVVDAARASGADALHPGFGFLAESADFAEAVISAGLRWVGPPPAAIRAMGDKAAARRLATALGVPVVPGYEGDDQSDAALRRAARRIGFPILVKPAGGGGGKGMRIVRDPGGLDDAVASARREAVAAFADGRLILERLVDGPRHVEVQVLFDRHGNGVHLGERDCSIQRRHQKILEESPSPGADPATRAELADAALRLAAAVGYESAGTCEFLLADDGAWFFLEMNTRLQVEHPVTELVTGRDLVADQLRIAAGEPLGVTQGAADAARAAGGHAVEVRLYAEDAEAGFLPATGRIAALRWPAMPEVRIDAGIDAGEVITGRFDPMLAKVIAHGPDRRAALDRLTTALDGLVVLGLTTNLRFLRWLVREPEVRDGQARIDTLDRIWPPADWVARRAIPDAAWTAAARVLAAPEADGWRLNAPARIRLLADGTFERTIASGAAVDGDPAGRHVPSPDLAPDGDLVHVDVGGRSVAFRVAPPPDVDRAARAAATHHGGGPVDVTAPMPGNILAVHALAGAAVEAGDPIVTIEAMKMEHLVVAPIAGIVVEVPARRAAQVVRGQLLAIVEP